MTEQIFDPTKQYLRCEVIRNSEFRMVYRAFDQENGIDAEWTEITLLNVKQDRIRKLIEYIKVLRSHPHQNILQLFSVWIDLEKLNPRLFYVSELFTTETLRTYISEDVKNPTRAVISKWCHQILDGLEHLHSLTPPCPHSLIQCDNIFIDPSEGSVKLGVPDLGVLVHNEVFPLSAPEVHNGIGQIKSDVWLLGLTVIEMATDEIPYSDIKTPRLQTMAIIAGTLPSAITQVSDPIVADFITNCLLPVGQRPTVSQLRESALIADFTENLPTPRSMHVADHHSTAFNESLQALIARQQKEIEDLKRKQLEIRVRLKKKVEEKLKQKNTF